MFGELEKYTLFIIDEIIADYLLHGSIKSENERIEVISKITKTLRNYGEFIEKQYNKEQEKK